jgi:hypothetical protein
MKIKDVINSIGVVINREEREFVSRHGDDVRLTNLNEREVWLAQNLVRKGLYEISNSAGQITRVKNVFSLRPNT